MKLPTGIDVTAFDALQEDVSRWRDALASIAAGYAATPDTPFTPVTSGTVLVGLIGQALVVKLYPPFLRDHFAFECEAMKALHGRLGIPTPRLVATGERDGWPYIVMTQLTGDPLTDVWQALTEPRKCQVLASLGALAAEVHALPTGELARLAPAWETFLQRQRERCQERQRRTGLPDHLLVQVEAFVAGEVPSGEPVILTGEYTPMNLLHGPAGLSGMFDFGDGLVGPREYDWLGPLCFLAAGHKARCDALFGGYGLALGPAWRPGLLRLLLLHRYSHLRAQIAWEGWEQARSFEELAELIWP